MGSGLRAGDRKRKAYATWELIRRQTATRFAVHYRALAAKYHPDNVSEEQKPAMTALLMHINRSYEMLGDEDSRFLHDTIIISYFDVTLPSFDKAYAKFTARRNEAIDSNDGDEYWRKEPSIPSEYLEKSAQEAVSARQPEAEQSSRSGRRTRPPRARLPLKSLRHSAICPREVAGAGNFEAGNTTGECPACGEPYLSPQGRAGPIHCERCGETLLSE